MMGRRAGATQGHSTLLLLAPALIFLCLFFLYPVVNIFWLSVSYPKIGLGAYREFFSEGFYLQALGRTFRISLIVTIACLLLGYPMAYAIARVRGTIGIVLLAVVAISFWTSYLVRAYAWMVILASKGPIAQALAWLGIENRPELIYNQFSVFVGLIHALLPYMILTLYAVMKKIDPQYLRASASLGARPWTQFSTVFLPLSLPGVVNGCTLVFIFCLGFYATPALLGGPSDMMLPVLIGQQINELLEWGVAGAMTSVLIVSTLAILVIYNRFFGLRKLWG